MPQVTALSPLGTPGLPYVFGPKDPVAGVTYYGRGAIYFHDDSHWRIKIPYFEVTMEADVGEVHARLRDITSDDVVTDSPVSTTESSATRCRSSALTLSDAHEYRAEFGTAEGDAGIGYAATLVAV